MAHPGGEEDLWQAADRVPLLHRGSAGGDPKLDTACKQAVAHGDVCLAVGPEGGFADEEVALAVAAGWSTVDLGPRILRVETAALLLAAVFGR